MLDEISFSWPLGLDCYITPTRKKMVNTYPPINIGDIVTPFFFHKNGKPIQPHQRDYANKADIVGVVVREFMHQEYNEECYEVTWSVKSKNDSGRSSYYIKKNVGCYLVKLS